MLLPLYLGGKLNNSRGFELFHVINIHMWGGGRTLKIHLNGTLFVSLPLSLITNALKQITLKLCGTK